MLAMSPIRLRLASQTLSAVRPVVLATLLALAAGPACADADDRATQPLWELGLGVAALQLPDYRGADVSQRLLLPLPYVVYRGHWLRADRDGARAVFVETPRWELTLSAHAGAPSRSRDNPARAGMADLPGTVELGPQLTAHLWRRAEPDAARLDLLLPVRSVIGLTRRPAIIGSTFVPTLNLDLPRLGGRWNPGLQAGLSWGSQRLHAHYYGVPEADATATRPAWTARSGQAGWHTLASLSSRIDHTWIGAFVRYDRLGGAVFADSPLVRQRHALSAGVAVAWVLAQSDQTAPSTD